MERGLELTEEGGPFLSPGTRDLQRGADEPCAATSWNTYEVRPDPGDGPGSAQRPLSRCRFLLWFPQRLHSAPRVPKTSSLGHGHSTAAR